ncbi:MAG: response regulator transcription factor [Flavobacteriales bacterium]|nr:response regulator transcription factor [Flavobacteriales bacterium]NQX99094.1 response regulator transcription factor [Flavobacteriales bacterium]
MLESKIKVILVDDHQIVREGFKLMLLLDDRFETIGEAESGNALYSLLKEKKPDVVVLDISMPGKSGIDVCKELKQIYSGIKILFLTANVDITHLKGAVKSGADGFLPKDTSTEEFTTAIIEVSKGNSYFSQKVSGLMVKVMTMSIDDKETELTLRELEIVKQLADGNPQKEIAANLFISIRTVESHKKNIQTKLGIENTVDLVKYAIREGLTIL